MTKTTDKTPATTAIDPVLPFEQALAELEAIVAGLEKGDVALERSISLFERGRLLRDHCDRLLRDAEARIEKITGSDGAVEAVAFDEQS